MRLVIDLDEKYTDLFNDFIKASKATIIKEELDFWTELPEHVKAGIKKSQEQVRDGQTISYEEVKKKLGDKWPSK